MKTVILDFDDGSVLRNRYDLLFTLKEHYPNLKVSLFFIPYDYETEMGSMSIIRDKRLETLKSMLDWIELIPHGLTHIPNEFYKADKEAMELSIKAIDEVMGKDNLPYVKGFKAPYWLWNKEVVEVLDKHNWFGAIDKMQPDMDKPKRSYVYTHSIEEPFFLSNLDEWRLHGHMTPPSENNFEDCLLNLMRIPHDAQFKFVSEVV